MPLLVRVLAGNSVTSTIVLSCLNTADARHLRCLHPAVCAVVAGVPWCDTNTRVVDTVWWRTCFPAAVGARGTERAGEDLLASEPAVAALDSVQVLVLEWAGATDGLLLRLPTSLHTLNVRYCQKLTGNASFAHLTALASLDCSETAVASKQTDDLPLSLQVLDISGARGLLPGASLAHLRQLRKLRANKSRLDPRTLASLPPSLEVLHAARCMSLKPVASFAHLTALRVLDVLLTAIGDASLATMPHSLVSLNARWCENLTSAAVLPHLPALQLLDVTDTAIGDALVASLPATLVELRLMCCRRVTASGRLDHLRALRVLHCTDTDLSPAALAVCRERGCVVTAASALRGHTGNDVLSLALLPGGRLASGNNDGTVRLWDVARGGEATALLEGHGGDVTALATLPDGRRLATGVSADWGEAGAIVVWDTGVVPPTRCATIDCGSGVHALAVLRDGRLAAGCKDGGVWLVEVGAGAVAATLKGHTDTVAALVVLADGVLASGSFDCTVRLWDVGAQVCVATLAGHTDRVYALAVLADGRLATGSGDGSVRLWDVATRACVGVQYGHTCAEFALAALPDGRLASGSWDTIRVWDTRLVAASTGTAALVPGSAARATPSVVLEGITLLVFALQALPGSRLASGSGVGTVHLWLLPPL